MSWRTKEGAPKVWRSKETRLRFEGQQCPACSSLSLEKKPVCPHCGEKINNYDHGSADDQELKEESENQFVFTSRARQRV